MLWLWAFPFTIPGEVHYFLPSELTDIIMTGSRFKVIYPQNWLLELPPRAHEHPESGASLFSVPRGACLTLSLRGLLRYSLHPRCVLTPEAMSTCPAISLSDVLSLIWRSMPFLSASKFCSISLAFSLHSWGLLLGAGFIRTHGLTFWSHLMFLNSFLHLFVQNLGDFFISSNPSIEFYFSISAIHSIRNSENLNRNGFRTDV